MMLPAPGKYSTVIHSRKLDLSYILPNVAVCSGPTDHKAKVCANNITDLVEALNRNHAKNNWMIVNLREEKMGYDPSLVTHMGGEFLYRPFKDHSPVPLFSLLETVVEIEEFLQQSPNHVVVVHCKHGKGRTGSIIVAYLMFKFGLCFREANEVFQERRRAFRTGITIPSQIRYMHYFEFFLRDKKRQQLYRQLLKSEFQATDVKIRVVNPSRSLLDNAKDMLVTINGERASLQEAENMQITYYCAVSREPDMVVRFNFNLNSILQGLGRVWINTIMEYMYQYLATKQSFNYFERPKSKVKKNPTQVAHCLVTIPWSELDGFKGTKNKGVKLLENVDIEFTATLKNTEDMVFIQRQVALAGMLGMKK
ncbi:hypothetical protein KL942_001813 [Ogataea angusta]|uniref:phosphatidylinositol-3,4,5-trisphosphate 3-phosphatase n=1 Tax=Pichia angusta TaxID=870730 RepID=A0ABQ7RY39_PICAN|nr:hypothetical protein KL909_002592 [Ogataea angusta]KAG7840825.1 hypothetical protein KL942_001813 [Ogataea angusta]KAG7850024.1 hypothetical protein KL940_002392 [Ogataea angusta]KAG7860709.1 hypothetical protein KL939_001276 [Ogataea angusta]KAG7862510.1 hypothetical protein KL919_001640 [Ogataea angusta]